MVKLVIFFRRGIECGPVNVLFQSNGKSLKLGQIKLGDMQVLIFFPCYIQLQSLQKLVYEAVIYPVMYTHNPELTVAKTHKSKN